MVVLKVLISTGIEFPQFLFVGINYQIKIVHAVRSKENMIKHFPAKLLYPFDSSRFACLVFLVM